MLLYAVSLSDHTAKTNPVYMISILKYRPISASYKAIVRFKACVRCKALWRRIYDRRRTLLSSSSVTASGLIISSEFTDDSAAIHAE